MELTENIKVIVKMEKNILPLPCAVVDNVRETGSLPSSALICCVIYYYIVLLKHR